MYRVFPKFQEGLGDVVTGGGLWFLNRVNLMGAGGFIMLGKTLKYHTLTIVYCIAALRWPLRDESEWGVVLNTKAILWCPNTVVRPRNGGPHLFKRVTIKCGMSTPSPAWPHPVADSILQSDADSLLYKSSWVWTHQGSYYVVALWNNQNTIAKSF